MKRWQAKPLGELLKVQNGFAFKSELFNEEGNGLPIIRIRDLTRGFSKTFYDGEHDPEFEVRNGDFLIGMDGEFRCYCWRGGTALLNQRVCRLKDFDRNLNADFVFYGINGHLKKIEDSTAYVTVKHLSSKQISSIEMTVPPLEEQEGIVKLLDEADELRKLRAQADGRTAALIPALFHEMFGDPTSNPKGFNKKPLGELIRIRSGDFLPAKDMGTGGQFPVYGGNGISGYHSTFMFEDPVIVIGRVGVYCGAIHLSEPKSWVTDNALYVCEEKEVFDQLYLVAALRVANLNQYAGRAAQPLVSGNRVYPVPILVPPLQLQHEFAQRVTEIRAIEASQAASRQRLENLFQSMLNRAFNGDLD